jgi:hypothetical protein
LHWGRVSRGPDGSPGGLELDRVLRIPGDGGPGLTVTEPAAAHLAERNRSTLAPTGRVQVDAATELGIWTGPVGE